MTSDYEGYFKFAGRFQITLYLTSVWISRQGGISTSNPMVKGEISDKFPDSIYKITKIFEMPYMVNQPVLGDCSMFQLHCLTT